MILFLRFNGLKLDICVPDNEDALFMTLLRLQHAFELPEKCKCIYGEETGYFKIKQFMEQYRHDYN